MSRGARACEQLNTPPRFIDAFRRRVGYIALHPAYRVRTRFSSPVERHATRFRFACYAKDERTGGKYGGLSTSSKHVVSRGSSVPGFDLFSNSAFRMDEGRANDRFSHAIAYHSFSLYRLTMWQDREITHAANYNLDRTSRFMLGRGGSLAKYSCSERDDDNGER